MNPYWKGKSKTVCRWHGIIYIKNPIDPTKILLELKNKFNKDAGNKSSIQKAVAFLYTSNKIIRKRNK